MPTLTTSPLLAVLLDACHAYAYAHDAPLHRLRYEAGAITCRPTALLQDPDAYGLAARIEEWLDAYDHGQVSERELRERLRRLV